MNKQINWKQLKSLEDFEFYLNKCKELVLKNIKESGLCEKWDGKPTNVTAEQHFNNIINWCNSNIKSTIWSIHNSARCGFYTSYGAKHCCERELKCYVANNWMKLAMIYSGLEVASDKSYIEEINSVQNEGVTFQEILTNTENFICRRKRNDYYSIKWLCIWDFVNDDLKYCEGEYKI